MKEIINLCSFISGLFSQHFIWLSHGCCIVTAPLFHCNAVIHCTNIPHLIHFPVDENLNCFQSGDIINILWTFLNMFLAHVSTSFSWVYTYEWVIVYTCFSFSRYCQFSKAVLPITFSPGTCESSSCSTFLPILGMVSLLVFASCFGEIQYLTVVLIYIFLIAKGTEHLFLCMLVICIYPFFVKCPS